VNLAEALKSLDAGSPLQEIAESLQVSKLCGGQDAAFFQYVTSSIFHFMLLRLHLVASDGERMEERHRGAIRMTISTLQALVQRMKHEMP
jgi:hypothetical protein